MNVDTIYDSRHITQMLDELGQPAFRTQQVLEWIWNRGITSYDEMTNVPVQVRDALASQIPLLRPCITDTQHSQDGTRKYLMQFADGAIVEVVGLPSKDRLTVCASTQIGCAMGCTFCATGQGGFVRNLTAAEIADTVVLVGRDFDRRVANVVMMGQGEPFANYDETLEAMRIMNAPWGLGIGARHITVSTAGVLSGIKRLSSEPEQYTLAVSLHSAVQTTRDTLMPGLATQKLDELKATLMDYYEKTGRRPSLEYTLIAGKSDTPSEVEALGSFAAAVGAHVNLIPLNQWSFVSGKSDNELSGTHISEAGRITPTSHYRAREIALFLRNRYGVEATVRKRRGADIDAACGQLRIRHVSQ